MLAQPTRRRLFALLGELGGAASTDELAERLALHPNGVRTHLQRMRDAGLVIRRRVARPRGRPRDEWAIAPTARPGGDPPHAYGALARLARPQHPRHARPPARGRGHRPRDRPASSRRHSPRRRRAGHRRPADRARLPARRSRVSPKDGCAAGWATAPTATRYARTRTSSAPCTAASRAACSTGSPPPPRSNASSPTTPTAPAARSTSTTSRPWPADRPAQPGSRRADWDQRGLFDIECPACRARCDVADPEVRLLRPDDDHADPGTA